MIRIFFCKLQRRPRLNNTHMTMHELLHASKVVFAPHQTYTFIQRQTPRHIPADGSMMSTSACIRALATTMSSRNRCPTSKMTTLTGREACPSTMPKCAACSFEFCPDGTCLRVTLSSTHARFHVDGFRSALYVSGLPTAAHQRTRLRCNVRNHSGAPCLASAVDPLRIRTGDGSILSPRSAA